MDALDLLHNDHERILNLFSNLRSMRDKKNKRSVYQQIRHEFLTHSEIEESVFYPTFAKFDEFPPLLEEYYDDHQQARDLLEQCDLDMKSNGDNFDPIMEKFIDAVSEHIRHEQHHMFPMVRRVMRRPERESLGRHIQAALQEQRAA